MYLHDIFFSTTNVLAKRSELIHTAEELDPAGRLPEAVQIVKQLNFDEDVYLSSDPCKHSEKQKY